MTNFENIRNKERLLKETLRKVKVELLYMLQ